MIMIKTFFNNLRMFKFDTCVQKKTIHKIVEKANFSRFLDLITYDFIGFLICL